MSAVHAARARVAVLTRHQGPDAPQTIEAKRELRAANLEAHIREAVDADPPLTAEQRDRLALLLSPPDATRLHPARQCLSCSFCGECGCDRGGLCVHHMDTPEILAALKRDRVRYETELTDPERTVAVISRNREHLGRAHTRTCKEVRVAVHLADSRVSDPASIDYSTNVHFPLLFRPDAPELGGHKRCSLCAPDMQEQPKMRRKRDRHD